MRSQARRHSTFNPTRSSHSRPANQWPTEFDEYVSDPAKPVPFRARPIQPVGYTPNLSWVVWLVDDQREFSGRTDVLTYTRPTRSRHQSKSAASPSLTSSPPHPAPTRLGRQTHRRLPRRSRRPARYWAAISFAVSMDIFRGRYRESLDDTRSHRVQHAVQLQIRAAHREPRLPPRPQDHGAGAVKLVPSLRPKPADLCAEHLLRQTRRLSRKRPSVSTIPPRTPASSNSPS